MKNQSIATLSDFQRRQLAKSDKIIDAGLVLFLLSVLIIGKLLGLTLIN